MKVPAAMRDLDAEFMLSRSYGTETALNWYNCGYSGGGAGGTSVGGNFGHFGFQVPYQERESKSPHAVTIDQVRAVRFDGNDFLKGDIAIERKMLDSGKMAVELWLRAENPDPGEVILGWQSVDGRENSAPLGYPPGFKGSAQWRHLVVNCMPDRETWYLDGVKVAGGPRRMLIREGHVMVLGGTGSANPSFKGALAAVRLHDEVMAEEEITHNLAGDDRQHGRQLLGGACFGVIGLVLALSPGTRGGMLSILAVILSLIGVIAAIVKGIMWFF